MKSMDPHRWHKELARVNGFLAIAIEKRVIGTATLRDFATSLERVAKEMRVAMDAMRNNP